MEVSNLSGLKPPSLDSTGSVVMSVLLSMHGPKYLLEECTRANPDARICPLTCASVEQARQAELVGSNSQVIILIAIRCSPNL